MNKQPKITDATREAFITAFFQLAREKNFNEIKIHEITNLAGYNRTTFYRYFDDVYDLVAYAENELLQNTWKVISDQCGETQIGERNYFKVLIQCFHENKDRISVLLSEQNRSHFLRRIGDNVTANISVFGNDTPKKKVIRDIYFYGIFYAISINLQSQNALPDEDLLDIIQKMFDNWYRPEMTKNSN